MAADDTPPFKIPERKCLKCSDPGHLTFRNFGTLREVTCLKCGWRSQIPSAWKWHETQERRQQ